MCLKIWCVIREGASNRINTAIWIRDIDLFLKIAPVIGRCGKIRTEVAWGIAEDVVRPAIDRIEGNITIEHVAALLRILVGCNIAVADVKKSLNGICDSVTEILVPNGVAEICLSGECLHLQALAVLRTELEDCVFIRLHIY